MSHDFSLFDSSVLFVQDVFGAYWPAQSGEVLQTAQRVLLEQVRHTQLLSSPDHVKDFLRVRLGTLDTRSLRWCTWIRRIG
jgi:DNA repair protein RadC